MTYKSNVVLIADVVLCHINDMSFNKEFIVKLEMTLALLSGM
jgi:hypothetical protein